MQTLHTGPGGKEDTQVFPGASRRVRSQAWHPLPGLNHKQKQPGSQLTCSFSQELWGLGDPESGLHTQNDTCGPEPLTHGDKADPGPLSPPGPVLPQAPDVCLSGSPITSPSLRPLPSPNANAKCPLGISARLFPRNIQSCRPQIEPPVCAGLPPPQPVPSVPLPVFPILVTALPPTRLLKPEPETCSHPQLLFPLLSLRPHPAPR